MRQFFFMDLPEHTRIRSLVSKVFTPRAIERLRPTAERLIWERIASAGTSFDLMAEIAHPRAAAPHCPVRDPMHALTGEQLIARLRRLGGTPEVVLREPELMAMFLPIVRADLAVNEVEDHRPEAPLACPIVAFGGSHDERCSRDELEGWRDHTRGGFTFEIFPGRHFFVHTASRELLATLSRALVQRTPSSTTDRRQDEGT